jgi:curli production assembly/transport component CsgF
MQRYSRLCSAMLRAAPVIALLPAMHAAATEMVYTPHNPSFGGNPLNGPVLMTSASTTRKHKDPEAELNKLNQKKSPLDQFNETLERSILSQLSNATASRVISDGKLIPGTIDTGNFTISINDLGGGMLQVTTTDKVTGATTAFQVSQQ